MTAGLSYVIPFLHIPSGDLVANLFRECEEVDGGFHGICSNSRSAATVLMLLFAAGLKILFTICTFGQSVPAGIFVPSMVIGACVGRAVGIVVQVVTETNV